MYLTDGLISVYDPSRRKISGFRFHTDDAVMCMAINHLFETQGEKFGPEETRAQLKRDIEFYLRAPSTLNGDPYGQVSILPFLASAFESHNVRPLDDVYVAFLGGNDYFDGSIFGAYTKKFRSGFKKLRDFSDRESYLTLEKSHQVVDEFDYVLSGNVLNSPHVRDVTSVFAACANILKPGGIAIHGINYSDDHYGITLSDKFHAVCAQTRIDEMRFKNNQDGRGNLLDAIVLKQNRRMAIQESCLRKHADNGIIPPLPPASIPFAQSEEAEKMRAEIWAMLGRDLPGPELS